MASTRQNIVGTVGVLLTLIDLMNRLSLALLPALFLTGCLVVERPASRPYRPAPAVVVAEPPPGYPPPPPPPAAAPQYAPAPQPVYVPAPAPQPAYVPPPPQVVVVQLPPVPDAEIVVVYEDLFGRRPADRELREWRERSRRVRMTAADVRRELRESEEFRSLAPEAVIRRAFLDLKHREPDDEAMRYYRRRMIDEGWTAGQVRQAIAHRDDRAPQPPGRRNEGRPDSHSRVMEPRDARSPDAIIERAYDDLLERKPDPEGRDRYRRLLQQGRSEAQIRAQIKESVEYRVTLPDTKTTRAYREVLGREPDPVGLEGFRHKIVDSGWTEEDVKNYLRQTAEYKNRNK